MQAEMLLDALKEQIPRRKRDHAAMIDHNSTVWTECVFNAAYRKNLVIWLMTSC